MSRCAYHDEGLSMPCSCPFPEPPKTGQGYGDHVIIGSGYFIAPNAGWAWALWLGDPDDSRPKEFATMEPITGRLVVNGRWPLAADLLGEGMAALRRLHDDRPGDPGWSPRA